MREYIPDDDKLYRHVIHPLSFSGNKFVVYKFIKLYDESDGSILASLAWERYLPTQKHVHSYGCRLARGMNTKMKEQGKFQEKNKKVYCGAFQLEARAVRSLPNLIGLEEVSSADVLHSVEEGEIAHTDLRIVLKPNTGRDVEGTKTAILDRLWRASSGPMKHICEEDSGIKPHPNSRLQTPPGGPYVDPRSFIERLFYVVRFAVCEWTWRKILRHFHPAAKD